MQYCSNGEIIAYYFSKPLQDKFVLQVLNPDNGNPSCFILESGLQECLEINQEKERKTDLRITEVGESQC